MKKILLIATLLFAFKVYALPIGNPSEASLFFQDPLTPCDQALRGIGNWACHFARLGYYGDFVFNRHLKTITHKGIDYSEIHTNAAYLAVSFWEVFELYTTSGASKFRLNTSLSPSNAGNPSPKLNFETSTTFSWSVGAHGTLAEYRGFLLGVEAQYFRCDPRTKLIFIRTNVDLYPEDHKSKYTEWQIGGGISYCYNPYSIPYVAVKCSRAYWEFNNETFVVLGTLATFSNFKSSKLLGYAVGLTLAPLQYNKLSVTAEGRFGDEKALFVNGQIHF